MNRRGFFLGCVSAATTLFLAVGPAGETGISGAADEAVPVWAKRIDNMWGGVRVSGGLADAQGGCLAVGDSGYSSNLDAWAVHLDKSGAVLDQKTYAGSQHDRLTSICAAVDGGYLAAGWTRFKGVGLFEEGGVGLLMKLGSRLDPAWVKTFSASPTMSRLTKILTLAKNQGYLAVLAFEENALTRRAVLRLNAKGGILWARKLGDVETSFQCVDAIQTPDGGFVLAGNLYKGYESGDGCVVKIDSGGRFQWAKAFGEGGAASERVSSVLTMGGGDLLLIGDSYKEQAGLALKLDPRGNLKWQNAYKDQAGFAEGLDFGIALRGGAFAFVGSYCSNGVRIVFARCSATGKILQTKSYIAFGGPAPNYYETLVRALPSSDGGVFILVTEVMGDVVAAKMDLQGTLPKTCALAAWTASASKSKYTLADAPLAYTSLRVTVKAASVKAKSVPYASGDACGR
ncbi:MAG: hypothetical protein JW742_06905 [Candidatus Aminicenantes bacterium]|nr:hypothetical protein [Candidatus Aminicenantes bacterium]